MWDTFEEYIFIGIMVLTAAVLAVATPWASALWCMAWAAHAHHTSVRLINQNRRLLYLLEERNPSK